MRIRLIAVLVLLGLGGGYYAYVTLQERPSAQGETKYAQPTAKGDKGSQPVPVTVARVEVRDVPQEIEAVGRGQASESVTLKARVDGQVAQVPFREGQRVRRGAILLRLDPADFQARLRLAEANLARSEAQLAKARADLGRYVELRRNGFVSEEKVNELRTGVAAAEAEIRADQAAVELARLQLDYTTLRAPIDGVIGSKLVFPGSAVKSNDTALAVVNRVRPIHVAFAVPERHLPRLRAALAEGGLTARIRIGDEAGRHLVGKVGFIDNAVDAGTGTIQLKATLANADDAIMPGQFVTVRLVLGAWKGVATVPAEAIQQGPQGTYVFVLKDDMGIEQRRVVPTETRAGVAIVAEGLREGETVVTDGHLRLTPKSKVQVKTQGTTTPRPG